MMDHFRDYPVVLTSPAQRGFSVVPSDSVDLPQVTRGLYLGYGGDVTVLLAGGGVVTFANMAPGGVHGLRVQRVYANGTTADAIVGLV
ncbi:hypothetical protein BFP70_05225 [Thioclava sp. SK-1]|uniref:spike base protein, RCAP_Rcc01079 family n=1 Tax=Thioclava sp. SK-1 TaxID=1889770 RepID=UPI00082691DA|nr:hypothetical protein [Thioclava sp. SK-1]OCX66423.1 hypothetical protein BFP70_05225 [Thioclava sp. SK-1]